MLIDGNDDRGIDVAVIAKARYRITRIDSHVDDVDGEGVIFSRDCPEFWIDVPGGHDVLVMVNHFKSSPIGRPAVHVVSASWRWNRMKAPRQRHLRSTAKIWMDADSR